MKWEVEISTMKTKMTRPMKMLWTWWKTKTIKLKSNSKNSNRRSSKLSRNKAVAWPIDKTNKDPLVTWVLCSNFTTTDNNATRQPNKTSSSWKTVQLLSNSRNISSNFSITWTMNTQNTSNNVWKDYWEAMSRVCKNMWQSLSEWSEVKEVKKKMNQHYFLF